MRRLAHYILSLILRRESDASTLLKPLLCTLFLGLLLTQNAIAESTSDLAPTSQPSANIPTSQKLVCLKSIANLSGFPKFELSYKEGAPLMDAQEGQQFIPKLSSEVKNSIFLDALIGELQSLITKLRDTLAQSVLVGRWNGDNTTLNRSCCGDAAPKLGLMLRHLEIPARVIESTMHYYLVWDHPEGQIIICPTIRQFFGGSEAPKTVPEIFVGSIYNLEQLFIQNRQAQTTKYSAYEIFFHEARIRNFRLQYIQNLIVDAIDYHKDTQVYLLRDLRNLEEYSLLFQSGVTAPKLHSTPKIIIEK